MNAGARQDPLHGQTLAAILQALVDDYGWEELGRRVPIRCFTHDPSLSSSLKFLRRTPWARAKVEALFLARQQEKPAVLVFKKRNADG
jgi:uncharacterized protein (DUF2132 family)